MGWGGVGDGLGVCGVWDVEGGWWWRCEFGRGVGVGVGHGEMGVSDVVVVGAGAGGRVSWGVSVEVGIGEWTWDGVWVLGGVELEAWVGIRVGCRCAVGI